MPHSLEQLASLAVAGDRASLEALVAAVQGDVFRLALRMLWHPDDAEDASQEILVKVATRLSTFEGRSSLRTWVFQIASNHLLSARKSRAERLEIGFDLFGAAVEAGVGEPASPDDPEAALEAEEVKLGCAHGMLLCLDRDHRLAFVLVEVMGLSGEEAALVAGASHEALRKRLSRARERLGAFLRQHCGLADPSRPCRCDRQIASARATGRLTPYRLRLAAGGSRPPSPVDRAVGALGELEALHEAGAVLRSCPELSAPAALADRVRALLDQQPLSLLAAEPTRLARPALAPLLSPRFSRPCPLSRSRP